MSAIFSQQIRQTPSKKQIRCVCDSLWLQTLKQTLKCRGLQTLKHRRPHCCQGANFVDCTQGQTYFYKRYQFTNVFLQM